MKNSERKTIVKNIPLFSCLNEREIESIAEIAFETVCKKNTVIIHAHDRSDNLFVVVNGRADAVSIDPNGKQIVLNSFVDGDYFGEMSFVDGEPRSTSVITKAKSRLLMIPRDQFLKLLAANPDFILNLMKGVICKLRKATLLIEDLAFKDVYSRLVRLFYQETDQKDTNRVFREKLTHQEMADRIGASREMVSRILKELEIGKYISKKGGFYQIERDLPYSW